MFFNVISFMWGVKGDGGFKREINGLEVVLWIPHERGGWRTCSTTVRLREAGGSAGFSA
jgi:hypothetical protein